MASAAAKRYFLFGVLFFLAGFSGAIIAAYYRHDKIEEPARQNEVLGETLNIENSAQDANSDQAVAETAPAPVVLPQPPSANPPQIVAPPAPPVAKPKTIKVDICKVAKESLGQNQDQIEVKFLSDSSAAKNTYDVEMGVASAQLTELAKQRTQSVADYLAAISAASAKYNSSTSPDAFSLYQQERASALSTHNETISKIETNELAATQSKTTSQNKYDAALQSLETEKAESLKTAQLKYQAQIAGLVCS